MLRSIFCFILFTGGSVFAQSTTGNLWKDIDEKPMLAAAARVGDVEARRNIVPQKYRALDLNRSALENLLTAAPPESSGSIDVMNVELTIPLPDGSFGRFNVQESPVMEPELAAKFPEIKTYVGQGIDDPTATMRIDLTPRGFHAMILSANGDIYIDPYWRDSDQTYVSYHKSDFLAQKPFSCLVQSPEEKSEPLRSGPQPLRPTGASLRSYRLALACTGEYATYVCAPNTPTVAATLSAMVTTINRCSAVYEREFAIRFLLINNDDKLVYLDGSTDPYTNTSPSSLLTQNQSNIDSLIGTANYDFGHVFSTGGGGLAALGVICRSGQKARAETGTSAPVGDPYDIDYVVHEMGHQFGANHPFNSNSGNCAGGNRNAATAYEVGSGTTIMAYAGICSPQDLAPHSDDYFYTISYDEIDAYTSTGLGNGCPVVTATGNTAPTISALAAYTIPSQTPFALTAAATDPDGDTLTYCWEEFDKGAAQDPTANPRDNGASPIFRSFPPTTNPTRIFPSLTYILNNQNVPPATLAPDVISGEILPTTSRTMTYRVTVRDNHAGGGGSNYVSTTVTSVSTAGAFAITSPNTAVTLPGGSQQTVTWNVAGSDANGINCANVKISLSTDGGNTFPTVLASSVPNNGSAIVTIPQIATVQGRIKVEAVGNIFFDISDANFTITSNNNAPTLNITNSITVVRGKPTPTVATVGTVNDANGDALTISVSNLPYRATVTPSLVGNNISLSALVDCGLTTTLTTRTYPLTITVTDSKGATVSGTVNLNVTPNASPTIGMYPSINVIRTTSAISTPTAPAADSNGNLLVAPYSIIPTALPGGGTISIDQSSGVVTATATGSSALGLTSVRVTALDSCGAAAISIFNVNVLTNSPTFTSGLPASPVIVGTPYSFNFTATGAPAPTFSLTSGSLPPGLSLSSSGLLSGTATDAGTGTFSNITVTATNGIAPDSQQTFSLNVVTRAANYITSFGLTGSNAALLFDYDSDGISNLMEYALHLDPTVANRSGLPVVILKDYSGTKYLSMIFVRYSIATDLTYIVQGSNDLSNWSDLATSAAGATMSGPGFVGETGLAPAFTDEVRDTIPFGSTPRFLRLKVTSP